MLILHKIYSDPPCGLYVGSSWVNEVPRFPIMDICFNILKYIFWQNHAVSHGHKIVRYNQRTTPIYDTCLSSNTELELELEKVYLT